MMQDNQKLSSLSIYATKTLSFIFYSACALSVGVVVVKKKVLSFPWSAFSSI